jgi:monofunctional biosynthetic peptidoglycan transglycosylase
MERIAPVAALAMVAAEDQRFPAHGGFDFAAIRAAIEQRLRGEPLRGASTISQQVAKNLFLWNRRSWLRKGLEAWFTLWLELLWSKRRILEVYLNIAEMGAGVYGVEAASRRFFGISAQELAPAQAALLAAVLPNPRRLRADAPGDYLRQRQRWILNQMHQLGGPGYLAPVLQRASARAPQ